MLIKQRTRKLVLLSSSRSELLEDWELEVRLAVERCDVGDLEEVRRVMGKCDDVPGIQCTRRACWRTGRSES